MDRINVRSSSLTSVGFDSSNLTLEIEFSSGAIYQYFDVPAQIYKNLLSASSHGKFFDQYIRKANFNYRRLK